MKALTLVVLLALSNGCAHDPLDVTEIDAAALDARNRVNDLATELGELATPIMMFCGIVGDEDVKCQGLRSAYEAGRQAVVTSQRYIDAFAKTGQGLAIVEAGVTVIEAAVQEVRAETERLIDEVQHVASAGGTGSENSNDGGGGASEAGGPAGPAAEGEGAADAGGDRSGSPVAGGSGGSAPEADARQVAPAGEAQ